MVSYYDLIRMVGFKSKYLAHIPRRIPSKVFQRNSRRKLSESYNENLLKQLKQQVKLEFFSNLKVIPRLHENRSEFKPI